MSDETYLVGVGRPEKSKRDLFNLEINGWEAAKFLDMTERQFTYKVQKGEIPKKEKGVYLLGEVDRAYWQGVEQEKGTENLESAKTRLTAAKADQAELELAAARGVYHHADAVMAVWDDTIMNMRARLLSIPTKVAPMCEGKSLLEIQQLIKNAVYDALNELAEYNAKKIQSAGEHL